MKYCDITYKVDIKNFVHFVLCMAYPFFKWPYNLEHYLRSNDLESVCYSLRHVLSRSGLDEGHNTFYVSPQKATLVKSGDLGGQFCEALPIHLFGATLSRYSLIFLWKWAIAPSKWKHIRISVTLDQVCPAVRFSSPESTYRKSSTSFSLGVHSKLYRATSVLSFRRVILTKSIFGFWWPGKWVLG